MSRSAVSKTVSRSESLFRFRPTLAAVFLAVLGLAAPGVRAADTFALAAAIDAAQALHDAAVEGTAPTQVASGSKAVLQAAIDAAVAVRDDGLADQATVDAAGVTLSDAVTAFEAGRVPEADKTALAADLVMAQSLYDGAVEGTAPGEYAPGSKAALQAAMDAAAAVRDDPAAEPASVDAAGVALNAAAAAFESATVPWMCSAVYQAASPDSLTFVLNNAGPDALTFSNSAGVAPGSAWLSVSPRTGLVEAGSSQVLTAGVTSVSLPAGVYGATNTMTFAGAPGRPPHPLAVVLTVQKADQAIVFPSIPDQLLNATVGLQAQASSGLPVAFAVVSGPALIQGGTNLVVTGLGEVTILASQEGAANWNPAPGVSRAFAVSRPPKQQAVVSFRNLSQVYDGTARPVAVATEPAGLSVTVTYNGQAEAPVHAGTYAVNAVVEEEAYAGQATAALVVAKAAQTLDFISLPADVQVTNQVGLAARAGSGLAVTFAVVQGPGVIRGGTNLSFSGTGLVGVAAFQAGHGDWSAASAAAWISVLSSAGVAARDLEVTLFKSHAAPVNLAGHSEAGYPLDYTVVTPPAHGTLSGRAPAFTYTPAALFAGHDTFTYRVSDGYRSSELATVSILVRPLPANDFTGSGESSVALYNQPGGQWTIRTLAGRLVSWGISWGGADYLPVAGDYDGDGVADLMTYCPAAGLWYGLTLDGRILAWALPWGGPGYLPVSGDFDGDGVHDVMVYGESTGLWYGWSVVRSEVLEWALPWGGPGFTPVSGDFDGDLWSDHAVMNRTTGDWYVSSRRGEILAWGFPVAGSAASGADLAAGGLEPVSGDYNGDLAADLCAYDQEHGLWYIVTMDGQALAWAQPWGGPGFTAVSGDFDADGRYDLAVYDPLMSRWYIGALDGRVLAWGLEWGWGGAGVNPVGP